MVFASRPVLSDSRFAARPVGIVEVNSPSCIAFGCLSIEDRFLNVRSKQVSRSSRLTKLRVAPSASAISAADL
jgi:hypothetical protein